MCFKKTATVSITKIIDGNRFKDSTQLQINYSKLSFHFASSLYIRIHFYNSKTYLLFFNNKDFITDYNYSIFEIESQKKLFLCPNKEKLV